MAAAEGEAWVNKQWGDGQGDTVGSCRVSCKGQGVAGQGWMGRVGRVKALTRVAVEERGGVCSRLSTLFHRKSTVTLLWDSMTVFSTTVEPKRLYSAAPRVTT